MYFDQELIAKLLLESQTLKQEPSQYLANTIAKMQAIQAEVTSLRQKQQKEIKRHNDNLDAIAEIRGSIQDECSHWVVDFMSDPSGGSDKSSVCRLCEKIL